MPKSSRSSTKLLKNCSYPCIIWQYCEHWSIFGWSRMCEPSMLMILCRKKMIVRMGVRISWLMTEEKFSACCYE